MGLVWAVGGEAGDKKVLGNLSRPAPTRSVPGMRDVLSSYSLSQHSDSYPEPAKLAVAGQLLVHWVFVSGSNSWLRVTSLLCR